MSGFFTFFTQLKHCLENRGQGLKAAANMGSNGWQWATGSPGYKRIFKWSCILEEEGQFVLIWLLLNLNHFVSRANVYYIP